MAPRKSGTKGPSRKEKSLSILSSNFLSLYNRDDVDFAGVDAAASALGVARRRICDIVYVLESMGVMQKKDQSQYTWKGFVSERLIAFKEEGKKEGFHKFLPEVSNQREHIWPAKWSEPDKEKRNKISLGLVTKNFVKLLLCSDVQEISLDKAALALVGDGNDRATMRNKVRRRLSDSANVLSSMELLQKTGDKSRQPSFKWIGMGGSCRNIGSSTAPDMKNPQRAFGTEKHPKDKTENAKVGSSTGQHQKYGPEDFVFGPFTPNAISAGHENRESSQIQDLDRPFRAYQPLFSNQENTKELFVQGNQEKERWMGSSTAPDTENSKRASGTEKHSKDKREDAKDGSSTEQHQKNGSDDFVFGPFNPNATISAGHGSQIQDLDRPFRAYQPQFSNQAIGELVHHYAEAWNRFYDEAKDQ